MFTINKNRILCYFLKKKKSHLSFLLLQMSHCVCVRSVVQSCPTLCDPMDCSLSASSVHGIFQARILEWVAISSSKKSSRPRVQTLVSCISCIGRQILYHWATWEALCKCYRNQLIFLCFFFTHMYISKIILFHYGLSQDIQYSSLCYTLGPCCLSILNATLFLHVPTPNFQSISPCLLLGNHKSVLYVFKYVL